MSFFRKPTPLPVYQGGTGDVYFDYGYAVIGNGYSALLELSPSSAGNVMTSNGVTWTSAPPSGGGMVYPAAGIANSTGSAWGSSYSTSGANSVVVRDANQNISVNAISTGFTNVAAAGTTTTLTAASTPNFVVTGSGGQTYQLPDATTLPNGAIFTFNNNQSSGTIVVKNNSSTTIVTVQSGGFVVVVLQSNSIAAGTWDYHAQAPSNVSWSTNTFNYVGSITGATWNGTAIGIAYGGTGQTSASAGFNALSPITTTGDLIIGNGTNSATRLAIGANTYVLTSNGTTASWVAPSGGGSQATATALGTVYAKQTTSGASPYLTAFGYNAAVSSSGATNTAFGHEALFTNTTGNSNIAIGYQSGYLATGGYSTFIGWKAGYNNTAGAGGNIFVGYNTGYANTSGDYNTAIGQRALQDNTTGASNTAFGLRALIANTTASNNVAVGDYALATNTTGNNNVALGSSALISNTTGSENTAVGYQALYASNSSSGGFCTAFGFKSGNTITTGNGAVMLGYMCQPSGATTNYEIVIGTVGGNCYGKGGATGFIAPNTGGVYQGNNSSLWSVTSDRRLKKNIIDNNIGLEKISQIQVRNFEYRTEDEVTELPKNQVIKKEGIQLGAIAQEIQAILPDCVKEETTGVLSVNSDSIMWHMINAIKELNAKVIALETKLGV